MTRRGAGTGGGARGSSPAKQQQVGGHIFGKLLDELTIPLVRGTLNAH
jgi:hypothetical protein